MTINNLLLLKIQNKKLTKDQIYSFISMSINSSIKDYQISTMLNAIYFNGLSFDEIYWFTIAMRDSGIKYKSNIRFIDKHSTGGVGDKVTLIISPLLASLGIPIFKISGRGLGFTGGTIDKLESIGVRTSLNLKESDFIFKRNKMAIIEQTSEWVPADKIFYSIRNDTNTIMSLPLIVSSIMSKKLALGSKDIYLDIKVGDGALFNNLKDAKEFAMICIRIGKKEKVKVTCYFTNMNEPLGKMIGNKLEVIEAIEFLRGNFMSNNLKKLIYKIISDILIDFDKSKSYIESKKIIDEKIKSLDAFDKFITWSRDQGSKLLPQEFINMKNDAKYKIIIKTKKSGFFKIISTQIFGKIVFELGGGRINKNSKIDYNAGIILLIENGEKVQKNIAIIEVYSNNEISDDIIKKVNKGYDVLSEPIKKDKVIIGISK